MLLSVITLMDRLVLRVIGLISVDIFGPCLCACYTLVLSHCTPHLKIRHRCCQLWLALSATHITTPSIVCCTHMCGCCCRNVIEQQLHHIAMIGEVVVALSQSNGGNQAFLAAQGTTRAVPPRRELLRESFIALVRGHWMKLHSARPGCQTHATCWCCLKMSTIVRSRLLIKPAVPHPL